MKIFKKIVIVILIQAYFMSNICFAQQEMFKDKVDTLSPRVMLSSDGLKNSYNHLNIDYSSFMRHLFGDSDGNVFIEANGKLNAQGRFFIEMGNVFHQLNDKLHPVTLGLEWEAKEKKESIASDDLEKIQEMSDDLVRINKALVEIFKSDGSLPSREIVIKTIMQVNGLRLKYADLVKLRGRISMFEGYTRIVDNGLKCIDLLIEHTDVVLFGVKEEKFNIQDLFEIEKDQKILNSQGLIDSEIFGYRGGLNTVIKNLRSNVYDHSGQRELSEYNVEITQVEGNIIIRFIDNGQGFAATELEVIDLIFKQGFSRRPEAGKAHGLGLWLCRQIIEGYFQGTIKAENREDHSGAVFIITIPKKRLEISSSKFKFGRVFLSVSVGFGLFYGIMQYLQEFVGMANQVDLNSFMSIRQQVVKKKPVYYLEEIAERHKRNGPEICKQRLSLSNQASIEQSI